MKKSVILIFAGILLGITAASSFKLFGPNIAQTDIKGETDLRKPTAAPTLVPLKNKSAFVPYWAFIDESSDFSSYDRIIYFGITISPDGIVKEEPGFIKLDPFLKATAGKPQKKWYTIRMTDTEKNAEILNAPGQWESITKDIIDFTTVNKFDGVVLDLEMSTIPSDGLVKRITEFVEYIHSKTGQAKIPFALTIYGDTFYRKRPYDMEALGKVTEEVMIMAYDFHKAGGEPGPNFPFEGSEKYGYDFKVMVRDFLLFIPAEKLTIIYGMYGYDWLVDERKLPIKPAKSVTLHEVKGRFLDVCEGTNCVVQRDKVSQESEVNYIDADANMHIVWFDDQVSVGKKSDFMRSRGIGSIGYWAYGYY